MKNEEQKARILNRLEAFYETWDYDEGVIDFAYGALDLIEDLMEDLKDE